MDGSAPQEPQEKALFFLKLGLFEILGVVGFIIVFFFFLNYFNILRLDYALPFLSSLPRQNKENVSNVANKDPFKGPIAIKGTTLTLETITGHMVDMIDSKDKTAKLLYMQKSNGDLIKEPFTVSLQLKPILVESINGKSTEKQVTIDNIEKKDYLIVSLNRDPSNGKIEVTGIRINRIK